MTTRPGGIIPPARLVVSRMGRVALTTSPARGRVPA